MVQRQGNLGGQFRLTWGQRPSGEGEKEREAHVCDLGKSLFLLHSPVSGGFICSGGLHGGDNLERVLKAV